MEHLDGCTVGSCCCCGEEVWVSQDLYCAVDEACCACVDDQTPATEIRYVADVLQCEDDWHPREVAESIRSEAPSFSGLANRLPADRAEFQAWCSTLAPTIDTAAELAPSYDPRVESIDFTQEVLQKSCMICDPSASGASAWPIAPASMPHNVSEAQARLQGSGTQEAHRRFALYCADVEGAIFAFKAYRKARSAPAADLPQYRYHASCFVCAACRAGRLLKSMSKDRGDFEPSIANFIQLEWKKKQAFHHEVTLVRNEIEHIDGEACNQTRWRFYCFDNDTFMVTDQHKLVMNEEALWNVVSSCAVISDAIVLAYASEAVCEP